MKYHPVEVRVPMVPARVPTTLVLTAILITQAAALSPPWWERTNQIVAVLKQDPSLVVTTADDGNNNIAISVRLPVNRKDLAAAAALRTEKAQALATLLAPYGTADFNGGTVAITVKSGGKVFAPQTLPATLDDALDLLKTALTGNKLFVEGTVVQVGPRPWYFLVTKATAIQYSNDDISKVGQVATELAADAIAKVYGIEALNNAQNLGGPLFTSSEVCPATGCA
ncbi:hypothetical protein N2152v2_001602 [Parachlorella kessleri]